MTRAQGEILTFYRLLSTVLSRAAIGLAVLLCFVLLSLEGLKAEADAQTCKGLECRESDGLQGFGAFADSTEKTVDSARGSKKAKNPFAKPASRSAASLNSRQRLRTFGDFVSSGSKRVNDWPGRTEVGDETEHGAFENAEAQESDPEASENHDEQKEDEEAPSLEEGNLADHPQEEAEEKPRDRPRDKPGNNPPGPSDDSASSSDSGSSGGSNPNLKPPMSDLAGDIGHLDSMLDGAVSNHLNQLTGNLFGNLLNGAIGGGLSSIFNGIGGIGGGGFGGGGGGFGGGSGGSFPDGDLPGTPGNLYGNLDDMSRLYPGDRRRDVEGEECEDHPSADAKDGPLTNEDTRVIAYVPNPREMNPNLSSITASKIGTSTPPETYNDPQSFLNAVQSAAANPNQPTILITACHGSPGSPGHWEGGLNTHQFEQRLQAGANEGGHNDLSHITLVDGACFPCRGPWMASQQQAKGMTPINHLRQTPQQNVVQWYNPANGVPQTVSHFWNAIEKYNAGGGPGIGGGIGGGGGGCGPFG